MKYVSPGAKQPFPALTLVTFNDKMWDIGNLNYRELLVELTQSKISLYAFSGKI